MKRSRFLIVIARGDGLPPALCERLTAQLAPHGDFVPIWSSARAVVLAEGAVTAIDSGAVIGSLFRPGTAGSVDRFTAAETALIATGRGQYLLDAHWGDYVALIESADAVSVLRAPLGGVPCLFGDGPDGLTLASDTALLAVAGCCIAVAFPALACHLAAAEFHRPETCLAGIEELQGGTRIDCSPSGQSIAEPWSPWRCADPGRQLADPVEADRRLRDAILHAVANACRPHGEVVLRLSGGLDSSIVAAALADAGIATTALNLTGGDAAGDERRYARKVAARLDIPLLERERRHGAVDLLRSAAAGAPRPIARAFVQASLEHALAIARDTGAGAIVDGGGGDNVFCSLQSVRPIIDCVRAGVDARTIHATIASIATLAEVGRWTLRRRAWSARVRQTPLFRPRNDLRFLSEVATSRAADLPMHRWFSPPAGALPGKAAHIGLIAIAQSVAESFDPRDPVPLMSPLISQPVVEACLRIPTWLWYENGRNRAAARRAFADRLPAAVIERRSKGGPDAFIAALYQRHRTVIRTMLLDGVLAANGLLDRAALAATLDDPGPVRGSDYIRVMQLVDAEAWARTF